MFFSHRVEQKNVSLKFTDRKEIPTTQALEDSLVSLMPPERSDQAVHEKSARMMAEAPGTTEEVNIIEILEHALNIGPDDNNDLDKYFHFDHGDLIEMADKSICPEGRTLKIIGQLLE